MVSIGVRVRFMVRAEWPGGECPAGRNVHHSGISGTGFIQTGHPPCQSTEINKYNI